MEFKKTFCSSPWFHMRITSDGSFEACRWGHHKNNFHKQNYGNIKNISPDIWFQRELGEFRKELINNNGYTTKVCSECYKMEKYGKVSGRQQQLLKTGIQDTEDFDKTFASSPWIHEFGKATTNEDFDLFPQDWQIDLGNMCNSGCVMCHPISSSFLETEFKKIGILNKKQSTPWVRDPSALENLFSCLERSPKIFYMHFIGGEPLIIPAFKKILKKLIDSKLNEDITVGFTTNLTVWDDELIEILKQFPNLNIGLSIECLDPVNDYIRYGSEISNVKSMLDRWRDLSKNYTGWLVQIRTTPTLLSIEKLHTIYEYAWENELTVESCNFLEEPDFLRPTVLPVKYRNLAIDNLQQWINKNKKNYLTNDQLIINSRHPEYVKQYLIKDATSYINYLKNSEDESHLMNNLVGYLQKLEKTRQNSILDYIPHYEPILKSFGYC